MVVCICGGFVRRCQIIVYANVTDEATFSESESGPAAYANVIVLNLNLCEECERRNNHVLKSHHLDRNQFSLCQLK